MHICMCACIYACIHACMRIYHVTSCAALVNILTVYCAYFCLACSFINALCCRVPMSCKFITFCDSFIGMVIPLLMLTKSLSVDLKGMLKSHKKSMSFLKIGGKFFPKTVIYLVVFCVCLYSGTPWNSDDNSCTFGAGTR